jgi:hypothetical protein
MNVVFVAPYLARATLRFTEAIAAVPGARLGLLTQEPLDRVPAPLRAALAAHWRVGDALDSDQIVAGVRSPGRWAGASSACSACSNTSRSRSPRRESAWASRA